MVGHLDDGIALLESQRTDEAVSRFMLAQRTDFVAYALMVAGRLPEAEQAYRAHLKISPLEAASYFNMGNAQREQLGDDAALARAQRSYMQAISLAPAWPDPYINLGVSLGDDMAGALSAYEHALSLQPTHAHALANTMHARTWLGCWRGRETLLRTLRRRLEQADENDDAILIHTQPWHVLAYHPLPATLALRVASAHANAALRGASMATGPKPRRRRRRIHLAYLSSDLDEGHPVGQLMSYVFGLHERTQFRVVCYDSGITLRRDAVTHRIRGGCDRFHRLAESQRRGGIARLSADILLDLNGHTQGSRLDLLVSCLARVKTLAIGYPATLGGRLVDYVAADAISVGPRSRSGRATEMYSERVLLMPGFFLVADHGFSYPSVKAAALGGPAHRCSLSSFSQPYKVQPQTLDLYVGVLQRLSPSRCMLELVRFHESSVPFLESEVHARGLRGQTLQWLAKLPRGRHLKRASAAAFSLDTPGYNQGTSGLDALWAGLPLMTLPMHLWSGRMGAGLVRTVGLPTGEVQSVRSFSDLAVLLLLQPARASCPL